LSYAGSCAAMLPDRIGWPAPRGRCATASGACAARRPTRDGRRRRTTAEPAPLRGRTTRRRGCGRSEAGCLAHPRLGGVDGLCRGRVRQVDGARPHDLCEQSTVAIAP